LVAILCKGVGNALVASIVLNLVVAGFAFIVFINCDNEVVR